LGMDAGTTCPTETPMPHSNEHEFAVFWVK